MPETPLPSPTRRITLALAALALVTGACRQTFVPADRADDTTTDESVPSHPITGEPAEPQLSGPDPFLYDTACNAEDVRADYGAFDHGELDLQARVFIAVSSDGIVATTTARALQSITAVNALLAQADIQLQVVSTSLLAPDDAYFTDPYQTGPLWNDMVTGVIGTPSKALTIVFVDRIAWSGNGTIAGYGGYAGAVMAVSAGLETPSFAQEIAHALSLGHSHSCVDGPAGGIPDVPFDPGPKFNAGSYAIEDCPQAAFGLCTDTCATTCDDGSTPDTSNIMSYYPSECRSTFTPDQRLHMRCVLYHERSNLLRAEPCGNHTCRAGEDATCADDCGTCAPQCAGHTCGDDGCGHPAGCGTCGDDEACVAGRCASLCGNGACDVGETPSTCPADCPCTPRCDGRTCGSDGCQGDCGPGCGAAETCQDGRCVGPCGDGVCGPGETYASCPLDCICPVDCAGRACGPDGCGGQCGAGCAASESCDAGGHCVLRCGDGVCGADETSASCPDDCASGVSVSIRRVEILPGGGDETVSVPYPAGAKAVAAFLAPRAVIEHPDDQCDYRSTTAPHPHLDAAHDAVDFAVAVEHCGSGHYGSTYGFVADAVVFAYLGGPYGVASAYVDTLHSTSTPASKSVSYVAATTQTETFCALTQADGNADTDMSEACAATFSGSNLSVSVEQDDGGGDGIGSFAAAVGVAATFGPEVLTDLEEFSCEGADGSVVVTHPQSGGPSHAELVLVDHVATNTKNNYSYETACEDVGGGVQVITSCRVRCYGSGHAVHGYLLFLDGDFHDGASCASTCAGRCAGASDGCGGTCPEDDCAGCCAGTTCMAGTQRGACGDDGGACGACAGSERCVDGACASGCAADELACDGACVSATTNAHCGGCDAACGAGLDCLTYCPASCVAPLAACCDGTTGVCATLACAPGLAPRITDALHHVCACCAPE